MRISSYRQGTRFAVGTPLRENLLGSRRGGPGGEPSAVTGEGDSRTYPTSRIRIPSVGRLAHAVPRNRPVLALCPRIGQLVRLARSGAV